MSKKTFILDTNVILSDPKSIFSFEENEVIIPLVVIEELDHFKKDTGRLGFVSRKFSRIIDYLRSKGDLIKGVATREGGTVKISNIKHEYLQKYELDLTIIDNIIISTACHYRDSLDNDVILVSRDINVRIKGDILKVTSESYTTDDIDFNKIPIGYKELMVDPDVILEIHSSGKITINIEDYPQIYPNEYFLLINNTNLQNQAVVKYSKLSGIDSFIKIKDYKSKKNKISGINARSIEQNIAMDMLLDPNIKLVSLIGKAGTGKTMIALAVCLQEVLENRNYNKLSVARPVVTMGNDIGFLPGDIKEKLAPYTQPIIDNLEYILFENNYQIGDSDYGFKNVGDVLDSDIVDIEALTYIRGRSIPNQLILLDESQNLTAHEIKTILSRVGEGTKIILTGDPDQIDSPYLTKDNNGLSFATSKLIHSELTAHIVLSKGERSDLANLVVDTL